MMKVTLVQETPDIVNMISKIASICYDSDYDNASYQRKKLMIDHLYKNGHHSVFEHIYFTFKIEGISRACSHQLVRHRHASYTQRSQRYCTENDTGFVIPDIRPEVLQDKIEATLNDILDEYNILTLDGVKPEDARYVLPNATETELYMSMNLRELMHIANDRLCFRAQWEIRALVKEMINLVNPELRSMLVPKCKSGYMICNTPCGKM